jgi:hypothetical protein
MNKMNLNKRIAQPLISFAPPKIIVTPNTLFNTEYRYIIKCFQNYDQLNIDFIIDLITAIQKVKCEDRNYLDVVASRVNNFRAKYKGIDDIYVNIFYAATIIGLIEKNVLTHLISTQDTNNEIFMVTTLTAVNEDLKKLNIDPTELVQRFEKQFVTFL